MKFLSLASSSIANAYVLSDGKTKILIECGLRHKELQKRLDFRLNEINACLITHEHADHSRSVMKLINSGISVYTSHGTAVNIECIERINIIEADKPFTVGTLEILPFDTYHDVDESLGFFIKSNITGEMMMFATDTVNIDKTMDGLSIIAIECNHDTAIMEQRKTWLNSVRPQHWDSRIKLLERISNTHMSIDMCEKYLSQIDLSGCKEVYLLHMSGDYSDESSFIKRIKKLCGENVSVTACGR